VIKRRYIISQHLYNSAIDWNISIPPRRPTSTSYRERKLRSLNYSRWQSWCSMSWIAYSRCICLTKCQRHQPPTASLPASIHVLQRTTTRLGDRGFAAAGQRLWKSLPAKIRQSDLSLEQFCRALKTHSFCSWLRRLVTLFYGVAYKCTYRVFTYIFVLTDYRTEQNLTGLLCWRLACLWKHCNRYRFSIAHCMYTSRPIFLTGHIGTLWHSTGTPRSREAA